MIDFSANLKRNFTEELNKKGEKGFKCSLENAAHVTKLEQLQDKKI